MAGIYQLTLAIEVTRPGTVLLGLGLATLVSANGNSCIEVAMTRLRFTCDSLTAELRVTCKLHIVLYFLVYI